MGHGANERDEERMQRLATQPRAIEPGEGFFAFHRFVGHGPRDDVTDRHEFDVLVGLEGTLNDGEISYDVYARSYQYSADEIGDTYVLNSRIRDLAASGAYDVVNPAAPSNAAAVLASSADLFRDLKTNYNAAGFSFTGSAFELGGGSVGWAVGGEVLGTYTATTPDRWFDPKISYCVYLRVPPQRSIFVVQNL